MQTFDSTMAYYINQLEALDPKLYEPLYSTTWGRDIKLRSGLTMGDGQSSFIRSSMGALGTQSANGIPWLAPNSTTYTRVAIDGEKVIKPLRNAGHEISYTIYELERSQKVGLPLDQQLVDAVNIKYQMHTDEMVYIGDSNINVPGLLNSGDVATKSVAAGASNSTTWASKTPDEILKDVNDLINEVWTNTGNSSCPDKLLLPPQQFAYIAGQKVSSAGNVSILTFLEENSISLRVNGRKLDIQPVKWLTQRGVSQSNRMVAYTNDENKVRFPMVPIRREATYTLGISMITPYSWAYGEMEFVYPETIKYADGI